MKKITELGKELRKIRIDESMSLRTMSGLMGYSTSYLSAIELGKKGVPSGFVERIVSTLKLDSKFISQLYQCEAQDMKNFRIKIDVSDEDLVFKEFAIGFARMARSKEDREKISKDLIHKLNQIANNSI